MATPKELIDKLRAGGMTDEEIAELAGNQAAIDSVKEHFQEQVITIEIVIPPGQDRELTTEQFREIVNGAVDAIKVKAWTSTGLSVIGQGIKGAIQQYLNKQSAGLLG